MKESFRGFFSLEKDSISKMWEEGIFVLDANVLLNFYRFSEQTCNELFEVFSLLRDRLWVPHQVAQEYFNNRLVVISDQIKVYDDSIKDVKSLQESLEDTKKHPFVSSNVLEEAVDVFGKLLKEFGDNRHKHDVRISNDEIKERVGLLLNGKVGPSYSREELEKIISEGSSRYEQKIPPGYKDLKKGGDSLVFADRCKPFGDYIVWKQIIDKACEDNKSIIFITNDVKDDWWLRHSGKSIGPHPALIEEFFSVSGNEFHMYTQLNFLERASDFLNGKVSVSTVDEVREAEAVDIGVDLNLESEKLLKSGEETVRVAGSFPDRNREPVSLRGSEELERRFLLLKERMRWLDLECNELNTIKESGGSKSDEQTALIDRQIERLANEQKVVISELINYESLLRTHGYKISLKNSFSA